MSETNREIAVPDEILNPVSGQLVRSDDLPAVAGSLQMLRERRDHLTAIIGLFTDCAAVRARALGQRTFHLDGVTLEVGADSELEWDLTELVKLREAGLPEERYDELVTAVVTYKVNGTVARQVAGSNPEYARIIEGSKRRIPKRPSATVKQHRSS